MKLWILLAASTMSAATITQIHEGTCLEYTTSYERLGELATSYGQPFSPTYLEWLLASPTSVLPQALVVSISGIPLASTYSTEPVVVQSETFTWSGTALHGVTTLTQEQAALFAFPTTTLQFTVLTGSMEMELPTGFAASLSQTWDGTKISNGGSSGQLNVASAPPTIYTPEPGTIALVGAGLLILLRSRNS